MCINLMGSKKGPEQHGKWQSKFVPRLSVIFANSNYYRVAQVVFGF